MSRRSFSRSWGNANSPTLFSNYYESRFLHAAAQIHEIHHKVRPESIELLRRDYTANGGWETFLSYEDPERDILVGLLRLRKCSEEGDVFAQNWCKKMGRTVGRASCGSSMYMAPLYQCMEETRRSSSIRYANVLLYSSRFALLRCPTHRASERSLWRKRSALLRRNTGASNLLSFLVSPATPVNTTFIAHFFCPIRKVWGREIIIED